MDIVLSQSLNRVRKLWLLVLGQGITYLYLAYSYLEANLTEYFRLGSIFVIANIALGLVEIILFRRFSKRLATLVLPASIFDIFFGISIIFLPFFFMIFLPFVVSFSQILRGSIYLIIFNMGSTYSVKGLNWLKYLGWARIVWAIILLTAFIIDINHSKVLAGISLFIDGLIIIWYGFRLKMLRYESTFNTAYLNEGIIKHEKNETAF